MLSFHRYQSTKTIAEGTDRGNLNAEEKLTIGIVVLHIWFDDPINRIRKTRGNETSSRGLFRRINTLIDDIARHIPEIVAREVNDIDARGCRARGIELDLASTCNMAEREN